MWPHERTAERPRQGPSARRGESRRAPARRSRRPESTTSRRTRTLRPAPRRDPSPRRLRAALERRRSPPTRQHTPSRGRQGTACSDRARCGRQPPAPGVAGRRPGPVRRRGRSRAPQSAGRSVLSVGAVGLHPHRRRADNGTGEPPPTPAAGALPSHARYRLTVAFSRALVLLRISCYGHGFRVSCPGARRIQRLFDERLSAPEPQVAGSDRRARGSDLAEDSGCPPTFFHCVDLTL